MHSRRGRPKHITNLKNCCTKIHLIQESCYMPKNLKFYVLSVRINSNQRFISSTHEKVHISEFLTGIEREPINYKLMFTKKKHHKLLNQFKSVRFRCDYFRLKLPPPTEKSSQYSPPPFRKIGTSFFAMPMKVYIKISTFKLL